MKEIKISRGEEWIDEGRSYTLKLSTGQQINLIKGETKSIKVDKFPATITAAISMGLGRSKEIVIDCNTSEIKVKGSKFFNGFTILIPLIFGPLL